MTKKMLINATQREELRVAIVDGSLLCDLDIEPINQPQNKSNIYKGRISRIEPSLEAAFIEYGADRHGFLSLKEIAPEYYTREVSGRVSIQDVVRVGQELIIQVDKDERGNKGAALTTYIGLAGCYLVLMPNNPSAGGISRRIEGDEREELRSTLDQLPIPNGMSVIVRTAGVGRPIEDLQWDLKVLLAQWDAILSVAKEHSAPVLIHQESDVLIRAIRDHLRPDMAEILIDDSKAYERILAHLQRLRPDFVERVKLYSDSIPLFNRYQIESQIETAYQRTVSLDNGASIVIDRTEALTAIDINSAKATQGGNIEDTAYLTNLAAAKEIARQLRLRDLGGLIVIDFIDMSHPKHQRAVENQLREELKMDRARVQVGRISRFGLLEMSRQRLRNSLGESNQDTCPRCQGHGSIRNTSSIALAVMRVIEEEAIKPHTSHVQAILPVEVATYLLNEKRAMVTRIEKEHSVAVILIPNPHMQTPHYEVSRLRGDEAKQLSGASYERISTPQAPELKPKELSHRRSSEPVLKELAAPPAPATSGDSLIRRIWSAMFGSSSSSEDNSTKENDPMIRPRHGDRDGRRRQGQRRSRGPNTRNRRDDLRDEGSSAGTREAKEPREPRDRDARETRELREQRQPREPRENRHPRENREPRDNRQSRENHEPRDNRHSRDNFEPRENREPRELREPRQTVDRNLDTHQQAVYESDVRPHQPELTEGQREGGNRRRRGHRRRSGSRDRVDGVAMNHAENSVTSHEQHETPSHLEPRSHQAPSRVESSEPQCSVPSTPVCEIHFDEHHDEPFTVKHDVPAEQQTAEKRGPRRQAPRERRPMVQPESSVETPVSTPAIKPEPVQVAVVSTPMPTIRPEDFGLHQIKSKRSSVIVESSVATPKALPLDLLPPSARPKEASQAPAAMVQVKSKKTSPEENSGE